MRYLDGQELRSMLSMKDCISVMRDLFLLPQGEILNPLRSKMPLPGGQGLMGLMPAYIRPYGVMGIKVLSVFPKNYLRGMSSHQGILHLFETDTGRLLLSLDADEVTAMRTAAVSALATDQLAAEGASVLALLGSGTQAHTHLEALRLVRPIRTVKVWSQDPDHTAAFIVAASREHPLDYVHCTTSEEAASDADVICTATAATDPILFDLGLSPHVHINAIGACAPHQRELDGAIIRRAEVYVDDHLAASHEAGDILLAIPAGSAYADMVKGDLHRALTSPVAGVKDRLTVFKSVGIAIEDVAVAWYVYQAAGK